MSTLKPRSIGYGLPQIPAGTSSKIRSLHLERRQIRDEHLILRSLHIKRSACEHYNLNAGVVLRSTSRNNPGGRFVARCLWREADSRP
jgi:hypothetical protein